MDNVIKETKFYDDLCDKRHIHRISGIRYPAPAPAGGEQEFEYPAEGNILADFGFRYDKEHSICTITATNDQSFEVFCAWNFFVLKYSIL